MNVLTITVQVQIKPDAPLPERGDDLDDVKFLRFAWVNNTNNSNGSYNGPVSLRELQDLVKGRILDYAFEEKMHAAAKKRERDNSSQ